MSIKVTIADPDHMLPISVEFGVVKAQRFTRKAAIELKNKLIAALDELDVYQAINPNYQIDIN